MPQDDPHPRQRRQLLLLIAVPLLLNLLYVAVVPIGLFPEEAQYWDWSRRLDWSYYSKGPVIAWMIALQTRLLGHTEIAVRSGALLCTAGTSLLLYLAGKRLHSHVAGMAAAVVWLITPLFSAFQPLMLTDAPLNLFWAAALLCGVSIFRSDSGPPTGWLLALGGAVGLGFLAKYSMLLIVPAFILTLSFQRRLGSWLRSPAVGAAALLAFLLATPVLWWNASRNWPTVRHVASLAGVGVESDFQLPAALLAQAVAVTPLLFFALLWLTARNARADVRPARQFLAWSSIVPLLFFALKSIENEVEANWPAAGYLGAIILLGVWWAEGRERARWLHATAVGWALLLALLTLCVRLLPWSYDVGLGRLARPVDLTRQAVHFPEAAREAGRIREQIIATTGREPFVFSHSYQLTSEMAFYVPGQPVAYCANLGRRLNQYDFWPGFETLRGRDAIYLTRRRRAEPPSEVQAAFASWTQASTIQVQRGGQRMGRFTVFHLRDFRGFPERGSDVTY